MAITSLDLLNTRIDLSDVLSWRIAQSPQFIQLFSAPVAGETTSAPGGEQGTVATSTEHKWLEGVETPKTKAFQSFDYDDSNETATFAVASAVGWQVGDLFHILGDTRVLQITNVATTSIVAKSVGDNGSAVELEDAPSAGTLIFDSRPIQEGSTSGEDMFMQSGTESNYTQIFRADIALTGTATAVGQYGNENNVAKQLEYATDSIIRRMNSALLFGVKIRRTASVSGSMGGLYYYGAQPDGLARPQSGAPALSINKINQAATDISEAGGIPDLILCGAGQAQVISSLMNSQVQIAREDNTIGRHVTQFVTSAGGAVLRVFVDPAIPDTDVWVCDSRGFALVPLAGRALHTEPATAPGTDGVKAMILGEYTAEFKNAKQSLCRISGLKPSALVLT